MQNMYSSEIKYDDSVILLLEPDFITKVKMDALPLTILHIMAEWLP